MASLQACHCRSLQVPSERAFARGGTRWPFRARALPSRLHCKRCCTMKACGGLAAHRPRISSDNVVMASAAAPDGHRKISAGAFAVAHSSPILALVARMHEEANSAALDKT